MDIKEKNIQEFEELLSELDFVNLKAFHTLVKALNDGEDMKSAVDKAVCVLLSYNRIETAAKLNEFARAHQKGEEAE